ncbi:MULTISPECIES: PH domain-containing protein [unclassified Streptomyces]|uniref:PH domain-containing protein n=1 Tax=unclassified Streptomyces TaxID=2593676 RepID=UPI00168BFB95|nr:MULTISPECIES: PH domain-containing protein [unclassified Streptomyces]MBD3008211.1 PH domain-containing protein [Streptomyces sp. 5-10]
MTPPDTMHTIDPAQARQEYTRLLGDGEQLHAAHRLLHDTILFTDLRLILIYATGVTGRKSEYHSIPYRSVSHFCVMARNPFDSDATLHIWTASFTEPTKSTFAEGVDVYEVQALLARFVSR